MRFLKNIFTPKEIQAALGVLDEAGYSFDSEAFRLVRSQVESIIQTCPAEFVKTVQEGRSPRQCVYLAITHIAGREVRSGQYHIYRGVLNTLGPGPDLLRLYDVAVDELMRIGAVDAEAARAQKAAIRNEIDSVG